MVVTLVNISSRRISLFSTLSVVVAMLQTQRMYLSATNLHDIPRILVVLLRLFV